MNALPKSVTSSELARLWGCGDRMVRQLAEKGVVVRCDRGRYDLEQSTRNYIDGLRTAAAGRASREELTPQQRWKTAQAELAEIELAKTRGEVLDRDTIQDTWQALLLAVRQTLLRLPSQIAFDVPTLSAHDRSRFTETCRNALWDLVLGRGFAVLGDSGERCDGCGGVIPVLGDDEEVRRANEHAVYPDEREKVLGTRSGEKESK
jgi:phage terminase Nu1 subunit (DNA packaging protein)